MLITVSLMSKKEGEIKRFLDCYSTEKSCVDDHVIEWIYVYRDAGEALDMMNAVMDHDDDYNLSLWVKVDEEDMIQVTKYSRAKITGEIRAGVSSAFPMENINEPI